MNDSVTEKPNLFIVGVPRGGTTSLYSYLKEHPEIFFCRPKEPQYFCTDLIRESDAFQKKRVLSADIRTEEEYLRLFKDVKNEKVIGEASTWYLYSKEAAENIHKFNPEAKIIILIRNPIDFLYSLHARLLANLGEDITDFGAALEREKDRMEGKFIPKKAAVPSRLYYSEVTKFSIQINRYLKIFPPENVKIILFEDFTAKTAEVYKDILQFLNVDPDFTPGFNVFNKRMELRFKGPIQAIKSTFLWKLPGVFLSPEIRYSINERLKKTYFKENKKAVVDPAIRSKLTKQLESEIGELSLILGKDLHKIWKC